MNKVELIPTPAQTVGPFFHLGCTDAHAVNCLAGPNAVGERIWLTCCVLDGNGDPLDDAMIEIWQADAEGRYNHPDGGGFGRMATDANGECVFETVKPGRVSGNDGELQAPHWNVSVFARGVLKRLVTRIYFSGEASNSEDAVLGLVPEARRGTLMARSSRAGHWRFEVRLSGDGETVFFEV